MSDENVKKLTDADFEFSARELSYNDRVNEQIPEDLQGVLLQKVETGGWASLGGLRGGDFLMSVDGKPTPNVAELKSVLDGVKQGQAAAGGVLRAARHSHPVLRNRTRLPLILQVRKPTHSTPEGIYLMFKESARYACVCLVFAAGTLRAQTEDRQIVTRRARPCKPTKRR